MSAISALWTLLGETILGAGPKAEAELDSIEPHVWTAPRAAGLSSLAATSRQPASVPEISTQRSESVPFDCAAVIEELPTIPSEPVKPRGDIRMVAAIGLIAAVLAFGFVGHLVSAPAATPAEVAPAPAATMATSPAPLMSDASTTPRSTALLSISEPQDGLMIAGPVIRVRAIASAPLGAVRFTVKLGTVRLGTMELGSTVVEVAHAGAVAVSIPVIVPRFRVPVVLSIVDATASPSLPLASANLVLQGGGPVELWQASAAREGGHVAVTVTGFAGTSVSSLTVEVRASTGGLVARRLVTRGSGAARAPGNLSLLDKWVFQTRLHVTNGAKDVPRTVRILWADPADGTTGELLTSVSPAK